MTKSTNLPYTHLAGYKFVTLDNLEDLRFELKEMTQFLFGTILISSEGINVFVSGLHEDIENFKNQFSKFEKFRDIDWKITYSAKPTYNRMLVRLKKEIITMGCKEIEPEKETAPYIEPAELRRWYDEKKDFVILDTRNDYEYKLGTFKNAQLLPLKTFREFPKVIESHLDESLKEKEIVTFCTGGIRCEKAAQLMRNKGFKKVLQLRGGILRYLEYESKELQANSSHYEGECFVFDKRVAVKHDLSESDTKMCFACRAFLKPEDLQHPKYKFGESCHHCEGKKKVQMDAG